MKGEFGIFLKSYMEKHGYTLEELGEKTNYSWSMIGHYVNKRRKPSADFISSFVANCPLTNEEKIEVVKMLKEDKIPQNILNLEKELYIGLDKRGRLQLDDLIEETSLMFNDESISEDDKEKMLLAVQEAFYVAKHKNKRKNKK